MQRFSFSLVLLALGAPLVGLTGCGGSPSATAPEGGKYRILLERNLELGRPYRVEIKDSSKDVVLAAGTIVPDQTKAVQLGFVGTQQAQGAGEHQPTEYVVEQLTKSLNGQQTSLLPAGAKIVATPGADKWSYTVNGKAPAKELEADLRHLFGNQISKASDDAIFGSKMPRAIGESWSVDVSAMPPDDSVSFDVQAASGTSRLVQVNTVGDVECLEIQAELVIPGVQIKGLPPGTKMLASEMKGYFTGMFPTDHKLPSASQSQEMDMTVKMEVPSPNGIVPVDMEMHTEHSMSRK
jgi:hypothetical protein